MSAYNFKKISTVPTAKDFVDIILSKTQRKTPTVVHKHYQISRIRKFYMRKVRFAQQSFHDRLNTILTDFPRLEDMHPFYADLLNTLYNKDHYKLSLGQLNTALHLIDKVSADYVKLLKYGDSLYRCKQLKRASLGRMVTIMKKQSPALQYLEEVRQHMSRLPTIIPSTRTLILCGCPNAGKSSFLNMITRADVEVQPYPFTTKSLYVGHTDYEYLRWQVIDTPGILDRPFDEMNTIELQAVTALAHIRAAVIFIMDISEQCNMHLEDQMKIYNSIKPLFCDKPLLVACNKVDVLSLSELAPEKRELIAQIEKDRVPIFETSTLTKQGIMELKAEACEKLLNQRVEMKLCSKKHKSILNRIHVAEPIKRDEKERVPFIPELVQKMKELNDGPAKSERKLEKDIMKEMDIDYTLDLNKSKILADDKWKYDPIPQFINGFNIADFIDPDIVKKMEAFIDEEDMMVKAGVYKMLAEELTDDEKELLKVGKLILDRHAIMRVFRRMKSKRTTGRISRKSLSARPSRSVSKLRTQLGNLGVDMSGTEKAHFTKTDKRSRSTSRRAIKKARVDSEGVVRSSSRPPRDRSGVRDPEMLNKVKKLEKRSLVAMTKKFGKSAESDRRIISKKPKHLYSGKRGIGKTSRR